MIRPTQRHPDRGNHRQELLTHALAYADARWPVLPIRPGTKRPARPEHAADSCDGSDPRCNSTAGHVGWEERATTDPGRITRAWTDKPWGVGIACGPAGLVVVDLDVPKDSGTTGAESLRQLQHEHGQHLPTTFTVATPSGGRHLYYIAPPGRRYGNTARQVAPGIDTRATGGLVVAPPTRLSDGRSYAIIDDHPPAELPTWFSQLLRPPPKRSKPLRRAQLPDGTSDRVRRYVTSALDGELSKVTDDSNQGSSNQTLFCASIAVGQLVGADLVDLAAAETALELAASGQTTRADHPNSLSEIRSTIRSGLRRGTAQPRQLPIDLLEGTNR